jgi:ATP-dependent protease ClpP protease subunit
MKTKIPLPDLLETLQPRARPFLHRVKSRISAAAGKGETQIDLYGDIGFYGVTAADFRRMLNETPGDLRLRINSRGGDVFDGIAIHNDLVDHAGRVHVEIAGLAASAASIIAMAGDSITIAESAFVMIHNAWGLVVGNRHDMAQVAEVLAGIDKSLARIYADRTRVGIRAITEMMDKETWFSGKDAVDQGFADGLADEGTDANARWDLSAFQHVPDALRRADDEPVSQQDLTIREMERALRDAGCSQQRAKEYAAKAFARGDHREGEREPSLAQRDVEEATTHAAQELLAELMAAIR